MVAHILLPCLIFSVLLLANSTVYAANKTPANILVLGDSLSAAFGMNSQQGWVALLEDKLNQEGYDYRVINASVSGDTTRTALGRIKPALESYQPAIVIVALGGNDGLRGLPIAEFENSLGSIIELSQKSAAEIVLVAVRMPPNYGQLYNQKFADTYQRLAEKYQTRLVTRMLHGVAEDSGLMQADGMHLEAAAQPQVLQNIWLELKEVL